VTTTETPTTETHRPHGNSKAAKVVAFFQANPDEALNADDIAEKFGASRNTVHTLLRPALDAEVLVRVRDKYGEYEYSAGPALPVEAEAAAAQRRQVLVAHGDFADLSLKSVYLSPPPPRVAAASGRRFLTSSPTVVKAWPSRWPGARLWQRPRSSSTTRQTATSGACAPSPTPKPVCGGSTNEQRTL
jgi:hypothetical protein